MESLFTLAISNTVAAGILAAVAVVSSRLKRSPQLTHALWLLVLIKLVTPPIAVVPVPDFAAWMATDEVVNSEDPVAMASFTATENTSSETAVAARTVETEQALILPVMEASPEADLSMGFQESSAAFGPVELTFSPEPSPSFAVPDLDTVGEIAAREKAAELPVVPPQNIAAERAAISDITRNGSASTELSIGIQAEPRSSRAPGWTSRIGGAVFFFCCFGTVLSLATLLRRCFRFRRIPGLAGEAEEELQIEARQFAAQLGLTRCPRVVIADVCIPPLVWCISTRPVIVLPRTLLDTLDPDQKRAVLMHELAHVRRRDYVVRWIEAGVLSLFWWNPLAWWACRQLREAEEECCDAWVVWALPDSRKAYGQALLKTVEFLTESRVRVVAGTAFGGTPIKRRVEMIMNRPVNRTMSRGSCALVLFLAVAVLPLAAQTATDLPTDTKPDTKNASATAPEPDVPSSLTPRRGDSPQDPKPRDLNNVTGVPDPDTSRFPKSGGGRSDRNSGARRPNDRSSSGRATYVEERQLSTEEQTLAALARMEDRIMRLEKIVQALALSHQPTIEKNSVKRRVANGFPIRSPKEVAAMVSNQLSNPRVAVSPNGKVVASLTMDDLLTTIVEFIEVKSGKHLSRITALGVGSSIRFLDDDRLLISGEQLNHLVAVPTGNLIQQEPSLKPATPAKTVSERRSAVSAQAITKEIVGTIATLEVKRVALDEEYNSLMQEGKLLALELELSKTTLEQEEARYAALAKANADESELEQQRLAVKQANLQVEKASIIRQFAVSKLDRTKASRQTLADQTRKAVEEFVKRYPAHPEAKKYLDLIEKESSNSKRLR